MGSYRNEGPPFYRDHLGVYVERGGVFEATDREEQRIARRGFGNLVPVDPEPAKPVDPEEVDTPSTGAPEGGAQNDAPPSDPPTETGEAPEEVDTGATETTEAGGIDTPPAAAPEWTLAMPPQTYLSLHPNGPRAEHARAVLAFRGEAG